MAEEEYDVTVKGREVPRHFSLTISPDAATAIRRVISEFREECQKPGFFGLREDEDEALEQLVSALKPEKDDDEDDDDGPGGSLAVLAS